MADEKTAKLDAYIEQKVNSILEAKANDPEAQKKAALQTKYGEAMGAQLKANEKAGINKGVDGVTSFGRFALGVLKSNNDPQRALDWSMRAFPDDKFLQGCFKALTVGTPSEGGFAVPVVLSSDIIQFLYPNLAYSKLGARRVDMPNGNMNIPSFDARAACLYIGETEAAGDTKPVIGNLRASSKKLAALIPTSNDLIRSENSGNFDAFVKQDLVMSLQLMRDYTAFYGSGSKYTPSGIKTQLTSSEKVGSSSTAFTADVPGIIKGQLMAKNVPMTSPGWVFNGYVWSWLYNLKTTTGAYIYRDEMNRGTLLGDKFVVSNQMYSSGDASSTSNYADIFYGDWSEFIEFVQLDMELYASKDATYVNSDGATVSAMQNDMTVLRALSLHDFGLRHKESFVYGQYAFKLS